jgi:hypothetical protein
MSNAFIEIRPVSDVLLALIVSMPGASFDRQLDLKKVDIMLGGQSQ